MAVIKTPVASAAYTSTSQSTGIDCSPYGKATALLDVTAVSGTTPTLDVKLQGSPDGVSTADGSSRWFDVGSGAFTQKTATGKSILQSVDITGFQKLRVVYTIAGTTPSFTFQADVGMA